MGTKPDPPTPPFDAGVDERFTLDGGLTLERDVGPPPDVGPVALTHVGLIDIAQEEDLVRGQQRSILRTVVIDTATATPGAKWRLDPTPATVERITANGEGDGRCFIEVLTPQMRPFANIGNFEILARADTADALDRAYTASFDPVMGYVLDGAPGPQLLTYSLLMPEGTSVPRFIQVRGNGLPGVVGMWPDALQEDGHFVPYALELCEAGGPTPCALTPADLTLVQVTDPPMDVVFDWKLIDTGLAGTERISARVIGQRHHLVCEFFEGREPKTLRALVMDAASLAEFRRREAPPQGQGLPLTFERSNREQLLLPEGKGSLFEVVISIRHTFVGEIRF